MNNKIIVDTIDYSITSYKIKYNDNSIAFICKGCGKEFNNCNKCAGHADGCKEFKNLVKHDKNYLDHKLKQSKYKKYNKIAIYKTIDNYKDTDSLFLIALYEKDSNTTFPKELIQPYLDNNLKRVKNNKSLLKPKKYLFMQEHNKSFKQRKITSNKMKETMKNWKEKDPEGFINQIKENASKGSAKTVSKAEIKCKQFIENKLKIQFDSPIWIRGYNVLQKFGKRDFIRHPFDFGLESKKLVIEFDGNYWHSFQDRKERDNICSALAKHKGFNIIRIDEIKWKKYNKYRKFIIFLIKKHLKYKK